MIVFVAAACDISSLQGKSAYQIALDNGFSGTEAEWLDSLKGNNAQSLSINDIYEEYLIENPEATFSDFLTSYLTINYMPESEAVAKALASTVSVSCKFAKTVNTFPRGTRTEEYYSAGSGVIIDLDGENAYIITNYHVVYDSASNSSNKISTEIKVYLYSKETAKSAITAQFVGGSINNDIAILSASSSLFADEMIKEVSVADSNDVIVGQKAIVAGNPAALGISVTSGIISVDSEFIEMESLASSATTDIFRVIRFDSAVNGGNSGGGLFNANGELIGIVNAKIVDESIESIAYAIPANVATGIAQKVISGNNKKALLGITTEITSSRMVYDYASSGIKLEDTVSVTSITVGAAAEGVFQVGDTLVSAQLNDEPLLTLSRSFYLADYLYNAEVGDTLIINVLRNGVEAELSITIKDSDMKSF